MSSAHRNRSLGHTDQSGRPDGVEVMVGHGHAHYAVQSTGVFCTADDTLYVTDTDARFEHPWQRMLAPQQPSETSPATP
jgi:hypothetical protein